MNSPLSVLMTFTFQLGIFLWIQQLHGPLTALRTIFCLFHLSLGRLDSTRLDLTGLLSKLCPELNSKRHGKFNGFECILLIIVWTNADACSMIRLLIIFVSSHCVAGGKSPQRPVWKILHFYGWRSLRWWTTKEWEETRRWSSQQSCRLMLFGIHLARLQVNADWSAIRSLIRPRKEAISDMNGKLSLLFHSDKKLKPRWRISDQFSCETQCQMAM